MTTSVPASSSFDTWDFGQVTKKKKKSKKGVRIHTLPIPPPSPDKGGDWGPVIAGTPSCNDDDRHPEPDTGTEYDLSGKGPESSPACDISSPVAEEEPINGEPECEAAVEAIPGTSEWDSMATVEPSVDEAPTEDVFWPEGHSAAAETEPTKEYEDSTEEPRPVDEGEQKQPKPDDHIHQEQGMTNLPLSTPYRLIAYLQQVLEQACFDCGRKRWPEFLRKHNWDCAEAVSLATWVKELEHLHSALDMPLRRGLLQSLAEVQTIAVERRPISWPRMRSFFDDAIELTEILDVKEYGEIIIQIRLDIGNTIKCLSRDEKEADSQEEKTLQWIAEERRKLDEREAEVRKGKKKSTKEFRKSAEREVQKVLEEAKKILETTAFFSSLETKDF